MAEMVIGAVLVVFVLPTIVLVDVVGRKALFYFGLTGMGSMLVLLGFAFHFGAASWGLWVLAILVVYIGCYSLSISPLFWLMTAELFPNRLRGYGASAATVANWSANLLVTLTFLTAVDALGKDVVFWIYAGFAAVGLVFVRFCIPETKGRALEDIDAYWTEGRRWPEHAAEETRSESADRGANRARSAKQVLGVGAQERPGPGPILGGDVAPRSADEHGRLHRVLGPCQVGGGGELVGDGDPGGLQLPSAGVGEPAPVLEAAQPGAADRDVDLAVAPGASEGVGDQHGGGDAEPSAEARPQSPGRSVGVDRQQDQGVVVGRVGGVDAGVGADESVVGDADQHAVGGAADLARLVEHDLDVAGILSAELRGELPARSPTVDLRQPPGPALGLGDDLVGDDEHVVGSR